MRSTPASSRGCTLAIMSKCLTFRIPIGHLSDRPKVQPINLFIILFGYFIQFMIFPSYVEMEKRSTERYSKALTIYTVLVSVAFLSVGTLGAIMFGD